MTKKHKQHVDVYAAITEQVLGMLDAGVVPWRKPWSGGRGCDVLPKSYSSRKAYRGINPFLLECSAMAAGYRSLYWITYKQAAKVGGQVRAGEHGTMVVFWKWLEVAAEPDGEDLGLGTRRIPFLRYFRVFNLDQCDGVDRPDDDTPVEDPEPSPEFEPIEAAAAIIENMPQRPEIVHREQRAFYNPATDTVNMPAPESFGIPSEYYSTAFHELVHSTGHATRLNRRSFKELAAFGSETYGKEELIAEFGAAFLCAKAGLAPATVDNTAAYIGTWKDKIKADRKLVVVAAASAQKAADFVLDVKWEK